MEVDGERRRGDGGRTARTDGFWFHEMGRLARVVGTSPCSSADTGQVTAVELERRLTWSSAVLLSCLTQPP